MKATFTQQIRNAVKEQVFVKITLSKKTNKGNELNNVYIRLIELKNELYLSFTYRYTTKDIVKNYNFDEAYAEIENLLEDTFLSGRLFTIQKDISIEYSRKRVPRIVRAKPSIKELPDLHHNKQKERFVDASAPFLRHLGITNASGQVLKKSQAKFKQINKYIEIMSGLLESQNLPSPLRIVDMGSGKGYLTFALYDYLKRKGIDIRLTGIELRQPLVNFCNETAQRVGFEHLQFKAQDIQTYDNNEIDILIALHACDIATDFAMAKGIQAKARLIVCAPCCHKQIRQQMNCESELQHILKHGILEERQAEMVTDGIRALMLEGYGYRSKVFEFISNEHTSKNLMIVGTHTGQVQSSAFDKIGRIKAQFGIEYHYLEKLLDGKVMD